MNFIMSYFIRRMWVRFFLQFYGDIRYWDRVSTTSPEQMQKRAAEMATHQIEAMQKAGLL